MFDYVFIGFSQPLVGTFSIPIGDIKNDTEEKRDLDLALQDQIIADLRAHAGKSGAAILNEANEKKNLAMQNAMQGRLADKLKQKAAKRLAVSDESDSQLIASDRKDGYGQLIDLEGGVGAPNDTRDSKMLDEEDSKLL